MIGLGGRQAASGIVACVAICIGATGRFEQVPLSDRDVPSSVCISPTVKWPSRAVMDVELMHARSRTNRLKCRGVSRNPGKELGCPSSRGSGGVRTCV